MHAVLRPEEPDGNGKGEQGPARDRARPLDTPWPTAFEFDSLDLNRNDLPLRGVTDSLVKEAAEGALMTGKDPARDVNMDRPEFDRGAVPDSQKCLELWIHRNFI